MLLPPDYTFTAADAGPAAFPTGATLITWGDQTITATDAAGGLSGSATVTVNAHRQEQAARDRLFAAGDMAWWDQEGLGGPEWISHDRSKSLTHERPEPSTRLS